MRRPILAATLTIFLSFAGEYMAYTLVLVWLVNLLYSAGADPLFAYGITGPVSFVYLIASGVLSVPFGTLADRYGRRGFTVLGCLAAGVGLIALPATAGLTGATSILVVIAGIYLFVGIGHASYTAGVLAFTGDVATAKESGEAFGLVELAEFASFSFAPALGGAVATFLGLGPSFVASGLILVLAGLVAFAGMKGTGAAAAAAAAGPINLPDGIEADQQPRASQLTLFVRALSDIRIVVALFATLVGAVALQAFRNFVPLFGTQAKIPVFYITLFVTIEAAASLLIAIPTGLAIDRTGRRMPLLVAGLLGSAVTLSLTVLVPQIGPIAIWSALFGVFIGITRVPPVVMITDGTVPANRAATMGTGHAFEHAGYGIGALVGGLLLSSFGFESTFRYLMLALIVSAVVSLARKIR